MSYPFHPNDSIENCFLVYYNITESSKIKMTLNTYTYVYIQSNEMDGNEFQENPQFVFDNFIIPRLEGAVDMTKEVGFVWVLHLLPPYNDVLTAGPTYKLVRVPLQYLNREAGNYQDQYNEIIVEYRTSRMLEMEKKEMTTFEQSLRTNPYMSHMFQKNKEFVDSIRSKYRV
jgi:hypothetical protein